MRRRSGRRGRSSGDLTMEDAGCGLRVFGHRLLGCGDVRGGDTGFFMRSRVREGGRCCLCRVLVQFIAVLHRRSTFPFLSGAFRPAAREQVASQYLTSCRRCLVFSQYYSLIGPYNSTPQSRRSTVWMCLRRVRWNRVRLEQSCS